MKINHCDVVGEVSIRHSYIITITVFVFVFSAAENTRSYLTRRTRSPTNKKVIVYCVTSLSDSPWIHESIWKVFFYNVSLWGHLISDSTGHRPDVFRRTTYLFFVVLKWIQCTAHISRAFKKCAVKNWKFSQSEAVKLYNIIIYNIIFNFYTQDVLLFKIKVNKGKIYLVKLQQEMKAND